MKKDEELRKNAQESLEKYHAFWACLTSKERLSFINFIKASIHDLKGDVDVVELATYLDPGDKNSKIILLEDANLIRRFSMVKGTQSIGAHLAGLTQKLETLLILIERFIVYNQVLNDKSLYQRALIKSLKERNSNGLFLKATTDFRSSLKKTQLTLMVAEDRWWLEHQLYYNKTTDHTTDPGVFDRNIQSFEFFVQLTTLRNYLEILNRTIYNSEQAAQYDLLFSAIVTEVEQQTTYPVLVELYILMINVLKTKHEPSKSNPFYVEFKSLFLKRDHELAKVDQFILVKTCINYVILVYHQLGPPWLEEMFEWMKYLSQKMLYSLDQMISDGEYLNFYVVAQALGEMDALADFEKKYSRYLNKEVKEQVLKLCESYALQREKKIDEALKVLEKAFPSHSKKPLKYDIRAKELRVMLCYENVLLKKKWEEGPLNDLERNIENLKKYCQRLFKSDLLNEKTVVPHQNFQRIASKFHLLQTKIEDNKKKSIVKKIEQILAQEEPISNRSWIKKQLALLGN